MTLEPTQDASSRAWLPSSRGTSRVLNAGALLSAACLVVALGLQLVGRPVVPGDQLDAAAVARALLDLEPWGWATLGVVLVIVTPAVGLVATAFEYRGRREAWLAAGVLGILGLSLAIALLR
jgi:hypothetical protein